MSRDPLGVVSGGVQRCLGTRQGLLEGVCNCACRPIGGHQRGCAEAPGDWPGVTGVGAPPCLGSHRGLLEGVC